MLRAVCFASAAGTARPSPLNMDLGHDQLIALARTIKCVAQNTSRALVVVMPFLKKSLAGEPQLNPRRLALRPCRCSACGRRWFEVSDSPSIAAVPSGLWSGAG